MLISSSYRELDQPDDKQGSSFAELVADLETVLLLHGGEITSSRRSVYWAVLCPVAGHVLQCLFSRMRDRVRNWMVCRTTLNGALHDVTLPWGTPAVNWGGVAAGRIPLPRSQTPVPWLT
jgi:hypothetical protein